MSVFSASAENANALSNEATLRCTAAALQRTESAASWNVDAGIRGGGGGRRSAAAAEAEGLDGAHRIDHLVDVVGGG